MVIALAEILRMQLLFLHHFPALELDLPEG